MRFLWDLIELMQWSHALTWVFTGVALSRVSVILGICIDHWYKTLYQSLVWFLGLLAVWGSSSYSSTSLNHSTLLFGNKVYIHDPWGQVTHVSSLFILFWFYLTCSRESYVDSHSRITNSHSFRASYRYIDCWHHWKMAGIVSAHRRTCALNFDYTYI